MIHRQEEGTGHNNGTIRIMQALTTILIVFWSCLMLCEQINNSLFIQCEYNDYTMDLASCITLLFGYALCCTPVIIFWIRNGFKQDEYL